MGRHRQLPTGELSFLAVCIDAIYTALVVMLTITAAVVVASNLL